MIIRYLVFLLVIVFVLFIGLMLVKELGDNRKKLEKQLKLDATNNNEQSIWEKGPKHKRKFRK